MTDMREVTHDEFFAVIGPQDVSPSIQPGTWPYTTLFETRSRQVRGKIVQYIPEGEVMAASRCYLPVTEEGPE